MIRRTLITLFIVIIGTSCSYRPHTTSHNDTISATDYYRFDPKPSLHPTKKEKHLIVIDPGHGGKDPGTKSWDKKHLEKNLNLATALMLMDQLDNLGYRSIFTRKNDVFIPLVKRATIANENNGTIFVSIHFNSGLSRKANGVEIFYFPNAMHSRVLASNILSNIITYSAANSRGVKSSRFTVLKKTSMPAVLVEGGFMSNPPEMQKLRDPVYLNIIAWGIAKGIDTYLSEYWNTLQGN